MRQLFSILLLFFTVHSFSQGNVDGFFKGKNVCDIALSGAYQHSDKFIFGTNPPADYTRDLTIIGLFAEYGITNELDVITSIPFINGKFQDMSLFVKYNLLSKKIGNKFSVIPAMGISFPLSNYETQSSQAIGQRAVQIQPKLVFQWQISRIFLQFQGGYNYALDPVPSSIPASVKLGYGGNKFYTDLWFDYQYGVGGNDYGGAAVPFRTLGVSYQRIGGVCYYAFTPKIGAFINYSYIMGGRNTGLAWTIGGGAVYKIGG